MIWKETSDREGGLVRSAVSAGCCWSDGAKALKLPDPREMKGCCLEEVNVFQLNEGRTVYA